MKGGFLLNVVVAKGTAVLELLAGKDQALLIGRDPLFICMVYVQSALTVRALAITGDDYDCHTLDFGLDIINGIGRLYLEGDSLARQGLHEDLHDGLWIQKSVADAREQ